MNIPISQNSLATMSPDELHLVREIKEMTHEKFAIADMLPTNRRPLASDITPAIQKRLDQNVAHAGVLFDELQGMPSDRFHIAMEMIIVTLGSFHWRQL